MEETKKQEGAATPSASPKKASTSRRKKKAMMVPTRGNAHVLATYNNTVVTITDANGNALAWSSAGKCGFKGPKKSTAYAAGVIVKDACSKLIEKGMKEVSAFVRGVGSGREAAVRALNTCGLNVVSIEDRTPIPHNGCRPKKARRV
ncbi:MAG: small subunit ribosomal protein S11 [Parcubacteria group bacterium Gr01-1014_18]|nr:MAG: small subunit ribosomal protein S11 [Parcubacteria group bacterium Greene0416_36]TSC80133.1 MAG: small subunit ribosomal protein S11 [Parcubacteria group bacterium Gr01-1014_18]TSC99347.1 MAG: small subunit ribosomal protein S11 [Parcubacteria group bacterium Greene1014_20]TSD06816.1 MAG: small subunit ribosomal protein S11 [Parcubacteria group bacterium Greene0714_2]